ALDRVADEAVLQALHPLGDLVEGLTTAVRMVRVLAVLRHPDRPSTQALFLEREIAETLRFAQLSQVPDLGDREIEPLGDHRGGFPGASERAGQNPGRRQRVKALGDLLSLFEAALGQPVALISG